MKHKLDIEGLVSIANVLHHGQFCFPKDKSVEDCFEGLTFIDCYCSQEDEEYYETIWKNSLISFARVFGTLPDIWSSKQRDEFPSEEGDWDDEEVFYVYEAKIPNLPKPIDVFIHGDLRVYRTMLDKFILDLEGGL